MANLRARPLLTSLICFLILILISHGKVFAKDGKPAKISKRAGVYEDLVKDTEKQYKRLEKFTDKNLFKKKAAFGPDRWDKWVIQWDERNLWIQEKAGQYRDQDPFIYDQFMLTLRSLNLLSFEYRQFFYMEKSIFIDLEPLKRDYQQQLDILKQEIEYLSKKGDYIAY